MLSPADNKTPEIVAQEIVAQKEHEDGDEGRPCRCVSSAMIQKHIDQEKQKNVPHGELFSPSNSRARKVVDLIFASPKKSPFRMKK